MKQITEDNLREASNAFLFEGEPRRAEENTEGHINSTIVLSTGKRRYILQRINTEVFPDPEGLMRNIVLVTDYLQKEIDLRGGDPARQTLTVISAKDGKSFYRDSAGNYWRAYDFIEDTVCYDRPDRPELFAESGRAFGQFQMLLADFPAEKLTEPIPDFHNTKLRLDAFRKAVSYDPLGRAGDVREEISFLLGRNHYALEMTHAMAELPKRVCHNDTKLSNVLFDRGTGKALCVIDLDTVMPGTVISDFGDAIRFGASSAAEDEPDLSKVHFVPELYEAFLEAFLSECGEALTEEERQLLPEGAKILTFEQALRFLGDYINGDVYYHTQRPGQNLDRARTQIRLLREMEMRLK